MVSGLNRRLLSSEREQLILESVSEGVKTVVELGHRLHVSEATVRRDLETLEKRGMVIRVHGGAEPVRQGRTEPIFAEKAHQNAPGKERIARKALDLISDHDTIFLDGGSTVVQLAKKLGCKKDLTVVTNSLVAAAELMESECRLIIVGGEFRPLSRTLVGPLTKSTLSSLHIGKAFMGTLAFSPERGMTTTDVNEGYTKELVMRAADQVILLADSSKFGLESFVASGSASDVDIIITDAVLPPGVEQQLQEQNIRIIR